jgi:plasmid maintenance system antidote protein VapI
MLQAQLMELGWTNVRLAKLAGVHPNTVTQWLKDGAPEIVTKYLELRIAIKNLTGD